MKTSAGVLIYVRDDENRKKFLLGKDSKYKCWSDFGGKYEHVDSSPVETASREFYEETDGIIMSRHHVIALLNKDSTKSLKCISYKNRSYLMFLVDVTDIIPSQEQFMVVRDHFKQFTSMIKQLSGDDSLYRFREKNDIAMFDIIDIVKNPGIFRSVFYNSFLNNLTTISNA